MNLASIYEFRIKTLDVVDARETNGHFTQSASREGKKKAIGAEMI